MRSSPWQQWLGRFPRWPRCQADTRRPTFRPCLEVLESRQLLSTFVVTNAGDNGFNPEPGQGTGTLRQAIIDSNAHPAAVGQNQIQFDIHALGGGPAVGPQVINLVSTLPTITAAVVLDGYTQKGASPNTLAQGDNAVILIELNAANLKISDGLTLAADNSTVRGLDILGAPDADLVVEGDNDTITGNFLGTDPAGGAPGGVAPASFDAGVVVQGAGDTVGGPAPADRNLISYIAGNGVHVSGSSNQNVIEGNLIGTDATGTFDLGNGGSGVFVELATATTIGGTAAGAGNVISGNAGDGISLFGATASIVQGNEIGTDATGLAFLGNGGNGITIQDTAGSLVGGSGGANLIAFNTGTGVAVIQDKEALFDADDNAILDNSIFANGNQGILLVGLGIPGPPSSGPNDYQTAPNLTGAQKTATSTTIQGTLQSQPLTTYTVQFFANGSADPSGFGQGKTFLGSATVTTDANGQVSFTATLPLCPPPGEDVISSTATDPDGNTSPFSNDVVATATTGSAAPGGPSAIPAPTPSATPTPSTTPTPPVTAVPVTTGPVVIAGGLPGDQQNQAIALGWLMHPATVAVADLVSSAPTTTVTINAATGPIGPPAIVTPLSGGGGEEEAAVSGGTATVGEQQPTFDAGLGLAFAPQPLRLQLLSERLAEAQASGQPAFRLPSAAEADGEGSLLLFQVEGKALRVGSSLAEADDSVELVEALAQAPVGLAVPGAARIDPAPAIPVVAAPAQDQTAVVPLAAVPGTGAALVESERSGARVWLKTGLVAVAIGFTGGALAVWWWSRRRPAHLDRMDYQGLNGGPVDAGCSEVPEHDATC